MPMMRILQRNIRMVERQAYAWMARVENTSVAGTPGYLAPELYVGAQPNVRSDIYSFWGSALARLFPMPTGKYEGRFDRCPHFAEICKPILRIGFEDDAAAISRDDVPIRCLDKRDFRFYQ